MGWRVPIACLPRSHGDDKISSRRRADILDAVLVVGMDKSYRAGPHHMACAIDRELHRTVANEPHFAVDVAIWRVRHRTCRQRSFVYLQRLGGGQSTF